MLLPQAIKALSAKLADNLQLLRQLETDAATAKEYKSAAELDKSAVSLTVRAVRTRAGGRVGGWVGGCAPVVGLRFARILRTHLHRQQCVVLPLPILQNAGYPEGLHQRQVWSADALSPHVDCAGVRLAGAPESFPRSVRQLAAV